MGGNKMIQDNFELVNDNIENWTDVEFVESDPYQCNQAQCEIVLCVDWENKSSTVETRERVNSTPMREYHKIDQCFRLPENVDASAFKKYYDEKIKPILQERGEHFEIIWNGQNNVGSFQDEDDEDEYWRRNGVNMESDVEIADMCTAAPEHDKIAYFSIGESFVDYEDIIEYAKGADIDFMTCDFNDQEIVEKIMETFEDDCVYIGANDCGIEMADIRECITDAREEQDAK